MKKTYFKPGVNVIKCRNVALLTVSFSSTEAAGDAESLSREVDFELDGEY